MIALSAAVVVNTARGGAFPARAVRTGAVDRHRPLALQDRLVVRDQALLVGGQLNALRVSWLYLKIGVINELQYRVNFFVQLLQSLIQVGTALVMLKLVYSHTSQLNGWTEAELLTLIGVQI